MSRLIYHPKYLTYFFGPEHPFSPTRQQMLIDLLEVLDHRVSPTPLGPAARVDVLRVHSEAFVEQVETASEGRPEIDAQRHGLDTADVPIFEGMDEATRWLCGGTLLGAGLILRDEERRVLQLGGGLHHAHREKAAGFCVYNDVAMAIDLLRREGLRVAYIDIDVHHGDGVQAIFYDSPEVLTISLHETGRYLYPGTGSTDETGRGAGRGYSINVPLEPYTPDESYLETFEAVVPQALGRFGPDVLVVECGADAHAHDPLAHLMLTTRAYERLFHRLLELADAHTDERVLFTLGGGYDLDATVRVWALLALAVQELDLPDELPEAWRDRWQRRLNRALSTTLHDSEPRVQHRASVADQNRETIRTLQRRLEAS